MSSMCLLSAGIPPDSARQVWDILREYGNYERHFNNIQNTYRLLASTWMLSAFGGIGYVLTKFPGQNVEALLIFAICIGAVSGMLLLCTLDLLVYHRLLLCVYSEAWRLEEAWNFPPLRRAMGDVKIGISVNRAIALYYGVPSIIFIAVAGVALLTEWGAAWTLTGLYFLGIPILLMIAIIFLRPKHAKIQGCKKDDCSLATNRISVVSQ